MSFCGEIYDRLLILVTDMRLFLVSIYMDGVLLICRVYLGRQCSELILSLQGAWRVTENAAQV